MKLSEMQRYDVYYDDDYDAPRMQRTEVGSYVLYSDAAAPRDEGTKS